MKAFLVLGAILVLGSEATASELTSTSTASSSISLVIREGETVGHAIQRVVLPMIYGANTGLAERTTILRPGESITTPFFHQAQVEALRQELNASQKNLAALAEDRNEWSALARAHESLLKERTDRLQILKKEVDGLTIGAILVALLALTLGFFLWQKSAAIKENSQLRQENGQLVQQLKAYQSRIFHDNVAIQRAVLEMFKAHGFLVPKDGRYGGGLVVKGGGTEIPTDVIGKMTDQAVKSIRSQETSQPGGADIVPLFKK